MPVWDDEHWLLAFVKDRHVPCPRCGYDLRNLISARCPECGEALSLRVGQTTPRFGVLVLAMAPGVFSGVCAMLLAFPLYRFRNVGSSGPGVPMYLAECFGLLSGMAAFLLYALRRRFLSKSRRAQLFGAAVVWFVHILAFIILLTSVN